MEPQLSRVSIGEPRSQPIPTVTLFIPVLNEIEGLKVIMPRIDRKWVHEILIVDGGSTDGSQDYLKEHGYPFIVQKKKGVKAAFWEAFDIAKGDFIIPFSPDNNSIPEDIPKMIDKINEGYDMVIASRYYGGMKSEDDEIDSAIANKLLTQLINFLYGSNYTDALTMFKAFRRRHLFEIGADQLRHEWSEILLVCRGAKLKWKTCDIPSREPKRLGEQGSHAHPGFMGKYKSGLVMLKMIFRDWLFYR